MASAAMGGGGEGGGGLRPCSDREKKTLRDCLGIMTWNHGSQAACRMGSSRGIAVPRPRLDVPFLSKELKNSLRPVPGERCARRPLGDPKWNSVICHPIYVWKQLYQVVMEWNRAVRWAEFTAFGTCLSRNVSPRGTMSFINLRNLV